jgi:gas vesicle protein
MNKVLSFIAGSMCGAVVGATIALVLAPSSGEELRGEMVHRWEEALEEARLAMEETRRDLQAQFEMMQQPDYQEEAE